MTPVTIGDQKFIKDINKGWIDAKTKLPADKGLVRLLDSLIIDEPILNKLRTKIDKSIEPVSINNQKFVYDTNHGWVDEKTKTTAPPSLQQILNSVVNTTPKNVDMSSVLTSMPLASKAGLQKTKSKAKTKQKPPSATLIANNDNDGYNKPLVKMINVLASVDNILKQRLETAKIIEKDASLNARESQIETNDALPQLEAISPDAKKVNGSAMGLLAVGGIAALLTLPPVQDAFKDIIDGVSNIGSFVTNIAKSINEVFKFLFTSKDPSEDASTNVDAPSSSIQTNQTSKSPQPTPVSKPSFMSSVAGGAATGALIGSVVPRVGVVAGGLVGGVVGAISSVSSRSTSSPSIRNSSAPQAIRSSSTPSSHAIQSSSSQSSNGAIPKNETNDSAAIVRLGRYLQTQGINVSENSAFGNVGKHSNNSRHYSDRALDLNISGSQEAAKFDALKPQLEAAGYSVLWRVKGHETHMHVSVGGPEGGGSGYYQSGASSLGSAMSTAANMSLEAVGKLFGILGSAIIKPGIPRTDLGAVIANAAIKTNAEVATTRTPTPTPPPTRALAPPAPNINRGSSGPTQNVTTTVDRNSVYYYLRRFGYQELSRPENVLNMGSLA